MRFFLKLAYDGSGFHGWQRQPNANSIQQTLEDAISVILGEKKDIVGAGRTDTGVHASEMYAHMDIEKDFNPERFLTSLNRMVGNAISVDSLLPVANNAHARFDAVKRSYSYFISLAKNPFSFNYTHRLSFVPDIDKMNEAAEILLKTDDFTSFAKLHADTKTNICKVTKAEWKLLENNDIIVFTIEADRFLRNMVRSTVGTLLDVGRGKLSIDDFVEIIERKDRCAAGVSMPAKGLFLRHIEYPQEIFLYGNTRQNP